MSNIFVVCGLGFGDEGKGHTVAHLTRTHKATTIIRYNGGPQAGHNVVCNGQRHLFSHFGAGMAVNDEVETFLSRQMVIEPFNLLRESTAHLEQGIHEPMQRIKIDSRCPIVTQWHKIINRTKEISRGRDRIGSAGMGVGETFTYYRRWPDLAITAHDLIDTSDLADKIEALHQYTKDTLRAVPKDNTVIDYLARQTAVLEPEVVFNALTIVGDELADCILSPEAVESYLSERLASEVVVLEGAQGTLLDYEHGTTPYVTKTGTRCVEAAHLLEPYLSDDAQPTYIGVTRPYMHRHGRGPLPTEDDILAVLLDDPNNPENQWQGKFRVGWFDAVLAERARDLNPELDYLVVTNLDRMTSIEPLQLCVAYDSEPSPIESLSKYLGRVAPIYEEVPDVDALVERIRQTYQLPLFATSAGEEGAWTQVG